jgi:hypothetical protein
MMPRGLFWISCVFALSFLMTIRPAAGETASSLFSGSSSPAAESAPPVKKPEPSAWQKLNGGTKKFFSGVGNALTVKKTPPKKPAPFPYNPWFKPPKEEPKPNWFTRLFESKKEKPKQPSDWINQPRLNP